MTKNPCHMQSFCSHMQYMDNVVQSRKKHICDCELRAHGLACDSNKPCWRFTVPSRQVNVKRNPFISRDNFNLLHFVSLNPPYGQICYKDVLHFRFLFSFSLSSPLSLSFNNVKLHSPAALCFRRAAKAYILMMRPFLLNNSTTGGK